MVKNNSRLAVYERGMVETLTNGKVQGHPDSFLIDSFSFTNKHKRMT